MRSHEGTRRRRLAARDSHNRTLLRAAGSLLPPEVKFTEYDGLKVLPPFDEDDESASALAVAHWRDAIAQADAILFATPEYNSSIPGQLKNTVDWASRPVGEAVLRNKPVAVIGASTGAYGALWSQAELRKVLAAAGARIINRELPLASAHEAFEDDATLKDKDVVLELDGILVELLSMQRPTEARRVATTQFHVSRPRFALRAPLRPVPDLATAEELRWPARVGSAPIDPWAFAIRRALPTAKSHGVRLTRRGWVARTAL